MLSPGILIRYFKYIIFVFVIIGCVCQGASQSYFRINNNSGKQVVPFKLLSNLIVFSMDINGKEQNFILDSGVSSTILFDLNKQDSLNLKNLKKIKLQGLGSEAPVDAILSEGNTYTLKNITGYNQKIYVIFDDSFDLSSKLGVTINGIIGYQILKDFIVNINYKTRKLTFYSDRKFNSKMCKKCERLPLEFHKFKPYINIGAKLDEFTDKITPVKLLIDSGGSDAMWLFEDSHPDIKRPTKFFYDFLGEGLSGTIYGKRAKIKELIIGENELKNPTVSYPDSLSISYARQFKERNGSIGASVLKRFNVTFDYRNHNLYLRKNSSFKDPFKYNMSGIDLVYYGKVLVMEKGFSELSLAAKNTTSSNQINLVYNFKYAFKPTYKILRLKEGSPAKEAGLMKEDIVIKINGKYTFDLKLDEIVGYFFGKEGKKITLVIERFGQNYEYSFRLRDMLK